MTREHPFVAPRDDVALMTGYHSPQLPVTYRLNTNEAPEPPPTAFIDELASAIRDLAFNRYPDRDARELREAIGSLHGVGPERVYVANGSNEVLQSILLAYGGAGRAVVTFEPTYALHSHIARVTGAFVVAGRRGPDLLIKEDLVDEAFAEAARLGAGNPYVTFVCSPNNPTGRIETEGALLSLAHRAPGLVVVDEAYGQFAPRSFVELVESYPNLVVARTFSKTWSLAAMRLGYAIGDERVVDNLFRVTLPYHLDAVKQRAGVIALRFADDMHARVERLVSERERVAAALEALSMKPWPSDANFILFDVGPRDARALWSVLVESSVLVRDVSEWPHLAHHLRVTIGTPEENDAFLDALASALV